MENFVERHPETPVENPVKPHDHAAKSIKENPYNDDTTLPSSEQKWDNRGVNKNGPESAANTQRDLNPSNDVAEEGLGMIVSKIPAWIETKDIAIQFLESTAKEYANAKSMRVFAAAAARKHGVTYQLIADIYGMTDSGVQMMLKRAGGKS